MKANILIVDDEANTLASLSRAFRLAGYEATICDSAARALELVKTQQFDLIFSDVVMPEKDGLQVCRELRERTSTRSIPVVCVSISDDLCPRALELGAAQYIRKPVDASTLLDAVRSACAGVAGQPVRR